MCVLGDPDLADALERLVKDRDTAGHSLTSRVSRPHAPLRGCHILYLSHVPAKEAAQIVAGLRDAPVLTISDMEGFGALGGITQFYFERGNLKFSVELETSKHARLADQLAGYSSCPNDHDRIPSPRYSAASSEPSADVAALMLAVMLAVPIRRVGPVVCFPISASRS